MSAPVNEAPVESASESQEAPESQTTETPAAEATVEPAVNESVEPTVTPEATETAASDEDKDFSLSELEYYKKYSRSNENAKNKALTENKKLMSELETAKSELAAIKHESTVNSVLSEYGLSTAAKALLTAGDVDGLKAQAAALAELTGGKVAPVTPVATEQPKFINPLQGTSTQTPVNPPSFGEMFRDIQQ